MLKWRLFVGCVGCHTIYEINIGFKGKVPKTLRSARIGHQDMASFDDMAVSTFNEFVLRDCVRARALLKYA